MAICPEFFMDNLNEITRSKSCIPGRKLPPVPTVVNSPSSNNRIRKQGSLQNRNLFFQEYFIFEEYSLLQKAQIPGVYVIPSSSSSFVWNGVVFVRSGHYCGGAFRFRLVLPHNFPSDETPNLMFTPPIYHPMVEPTTGLLSFGNQFNPWIQGVHQVWHLLLHLTNIFNHLDSPQPVNIPASEEYCNNLPAFLRNVNCCLTSSKDQLLQDPEDAEDDLSMLRFTEIKSNHQNDKQNEDLFKNANMLPTNHKEDV